MPSKKDPVAKDLGIAIARADEMMHRILGELETDQYMAFLSGDENFRYKLYPDYKANRKDLVKPTWLEECKEYLVTEWQAKVTHRYEADDAIGINRTKYPKSIIASIDKDLKQIPGKYFDFVKLELSYIDEDEANFNFWAQMLTGDRSDNVEGIYGIGPVKAKNILLDASPDERELLVKGIYNDDERFELNKKLFYILRDEEELDNYFENTISESERQDSTEIS